MSDAPTQRENDMHKIQETGSANPALGKCILAAIWSMILLIGCTNSGNSTASPKGIDIYLAGYESNGNLSIAKYWKNGTPKLLSDNNTPGVATSIFYSGSDLYVASREFEGNSIGPVAKIWKNNMPTALTDGTTDAEVNSIWVSGPDVYVAGGEAAYAPNVGGGAEYWKNADRVILTDGKQSAMARAITVSGGDIYVVGEEKQFILTSPTTGKIVSAAKIWKNGIAASLTDGRSMDSGATAVVLAGSDVYAAGWEFESVGSEVRASARLWKNGQSIPLANGEDTIATSIAVSLNDVYVVGTKYIGNTSVAMYWKNGQPFQLADGRVPSTATAVSVLGTEVYIAGSEGNYAKYWNNGISYNLTDGKFRASANSIFVLHRR